ncbi:MAG: hypothetical protein ACRELW_00640 [Candidatus Rokuibacteriota bacterium]
MTSRAGVIVPAAPPVSSARPGSGAPSWIIALVSSGLVVSVFLGVVDQLAHWFVVPVLACGVLVGRDAVDWARGRVDLFDPVGVIGLLGAHVFFLAPLLHVALDVWMPYVDPPPDWRDWLGWMAVVNAAGLIVYGLTRDLGHRLASRRPPATGWLLDPGRCGPVFALALLVAAGAQAVTYRLHGGLLGYLQASVAGDRSFEGMGWVFMISERFPIVAMLAFAILARRREPLRRWRVLIPVLAGMFLGQLLFGGLRGSRSMVVWAMFWAVGVVHVWVRPLSRRMLAVAALVLLAFMYGYGLYKGGGLETLRVWERPELVWALEQESGRTIGSTLLGDLGRGDVQAYLLFRLTEPGSDAEYAWGRTYAGGLSLLIPKAVWPARPPTKEKEGTEALYGRGAYEPGLLVASNVYGLAGESMLNFGPLAPLLAFAVFGIGLGIVRGRYAALPFPDLRWLLYPYVVTACIVALIGDSDNLVFFLVSDGLVPIVVVALCARSRRLAPGPARGGPGR